LLQARRNAPTPPMNAKLLAVLLAALVAGSLWFALAPTAAPTPVAAPIEAIADATPAPAAPVATAQGTGAATDGGAGAARTAAEPVAVAAGAGNALVRGRVVDAAGAPRAGVEVVLTTRAAIDFDDDFVFEAFARSPAATPDAPRARSGDDGRFAVAIPRDRNGALGLADAGLVFAGNAPRVRGGKGDQDLGDVAVVRAAVVRGRVQNEAGAPLADVRIDADRGLFGPMGRGGVRSGADGTFAVAALAPGALTLRAALAGHLPSSQELELQPEEERTGLVVTLRTGKAIAGRVVDDRGVGVAGIRVGFNRMEMRGGIGFERFVTEEAATTDQNGWFALAGLGDDAVALRAVSKEHAPATVTEVAVGTMDVVLRVERFGAIEGVLVGADGAPIAGSEVRLGGPGGGDGFEFFGDADQGGAMAMTRNGAARSGADGAFRIEGVKPGAVTVRATGKGHRPARLDGVQVAAAQTTKGIRLVADRGAVARVRVVDAAGAPVAGAKVRVAKPSPRGQGMTIGADGSVQVSMQSTTVVAGGDEAQFVGSSALGRGTTDADGRCEIPGLPAGDVEVQATHPEHAAALPAATVLPAAGGVDVQLALRQPGFVAVTVVAGDGTPVADAEVFVAPAADDGSGRKRLRTDAAGKATSPALLPGEYTAVLARAARSNSGRQAAGLSFMVMGGGGDVLEGSRVAVAVPAGQTVEATLRQPLLARVLGVVTGADGPVAGCVVELVRAGAMDFGGFGSSSPKATTGADGSYVFEGVDAGEYTLSYGRAKAKAKTEAALAVPAGVAEVRQDLALRTGAARLRVLDAATGKPIAGADVEIRRAAGADGEGNRGMAGGISFGVAMTATGGDDDGGMTTLTFGDQKVRTDEQGVAVFDDVPVGSWQFAVAHKGHVGKDAGPVAVAERQTADAGDVALVGAGSIRGDVVGVDGGKVAFGLVEHRPVGEAEWGEQVVANGGRFRINSLPAGRRELRARRIGLDGQQGEPGPVVEVEVRAGEAATAQLRAN
jgi:hypothetical protein